MAEENGTDATVVRAWIDSSSRRRNWAAVVLRKFIERKPEALVAVWGLTYKENTNSTKNSPSLATLAQFPGRAFRRHDPALEAEEDPLAVARGADVLMILTPWPEYRKIAPARIARAMRGRIVIDPYAVLDRAKARAAGLTLQALGRPADA
jgi:UDPglucose 6-dehydrogenase